MAGEPLVTYDMNRSIRQTEQCDTHWAVATLFCSYWTASMTNQIQTAVVLHLSLLVLHKSFNIGLAHREREL